MVWKEPSALTKFDIPIVYWTENDRIGTLRKIYKYGVSGLEHWKTLCEKFKIKYWCYLHELNPNNQKKC